MQKTKLEYTIQNLIWRVVHGVETMIFPFVIRTLMIHKWGIEYLGLNGLFASVLQVLNIAELGFGSAILFSMYKPMAEHDVRQVNALLLLYRKIYRFIGIGILVTGLVLLPFIKHFIHGTYPADINIYLVYLIQLFNTVISYVFLSYWNVILQAQQRVDVDYVINSLFVGIMYVLQIIVICTIRNYYIYIGLLPITMVIIAYLRRKYIRKNYPEYCCEGSLDKTFKMDLLKRVSAMALSKIRNAIRDSIDSLAISMHLGLVTLAQYQNYYQVLLVPLTIIIMIKGAVRPSMGVDVATESKEENYNVFVIYSFINNWITMWCTIVYVLGIQTFMEIWVGTDNMLSAYVVYMFGLYFYLRCLSDNAMLIRETTGVWWKGKLGAVAETCLNIVLNVVLVRFLGVEGVVLATVISMLVINIPVEFWSIFSGYFGCSIKEYMFKQFRYFINLIIIFYVTSFAVNKISGQEMDALFLKLLCLLIVPNVSYIVLNLYSKEFKGTIELCRRIIKK